MRDISKAQQAIEFVKQQAAAGGSETDVHNAFYGIGGKFGQLFPTQAEREAFLSTNEHEQLCRIYDELAEQEQAAH